MSRQFAIGKVFGIAVDVDPSWLLVGLFMAWHATISFRAWHPTWALGPAAFLGAFAALLAFGLVLARQLLQARVAERLGVAVRRMRLFVFGAVWRTDPEARSPRGEVWMAIIGALFTLGVSGAIFAIERTLLPPINWGALELTASPTHSSLSPMATMFFWLAGVNLALGILQLFPALPLDGGRLLRAAMWRVTGDFDRATHLGCALGRAFGWALVVAGVALLAGGELHEQLSLSYGLGAALVGWSLIAALELIEQRRRVTERRAPRRPTLWRKPGAVH